MSVRMLVRLLILLAALGVAGYLLKKGDAPERPVSGVAAGGSVLPGLDANAVNAITVSDDASTVTVTRVETGWVVASLYGYPARFETVSEMLITLSDLEVGQVMRDGDAYPEDYGLVGDGEGQSPIHVALSVDGGRPVTLVLGAVKHASQAAGMGMGMPQGRFLRVGEGHVVLADETFFSLSARPQGWIDQQLMRLEPEGITEFTLATTNGSLTVTRTEGEYALADLGEGQQVDQSAAKRLLETLQWFRIDTVYDPAITDADHGFDRADTVRAVTTNGMVYTISIGATTDANAMRPVRVAVSATNETTDAAAVAALNDRYAGWTFSVPAGYVSQMLPDRSGLITVADPEPVHSTADADRPDDG